MEVRVKSIEGQGENSVIIKERANEVPQELGHLQDPTG